MRVIDLLNKIANSGDYEEETHFKYFNRIDQEYDICMICETNIIYKLDETSIKLNDEVEIIEEDKKIEKIKPTNYCIDTLREKINEIIDKLNKEE